MNFSYAEFSDAFKLLHTLSSLSWDGYPCPIFEKKKNAEFYTSKQIVNVGLKLVEKEFKGFKGVVLEIYDFKKELNMSSKFIKADFIVAKGTHLFDYDNKTIKSISQFYPSNYGKLVVGLHYCYFSNLSKDNPYYIDVFLHWDDSNKIKLGFHQSDDLNNINAKKFKIHSALEKKHKKLWSKDFKKVSNYLNV